MHGAEGRCQVYGCVCEDVWHAWGWRKMSSIWLCVRMCGKHGAEEDVKYMAVCVRDVWHAWG